jgi:hypothetical protein
MLTEQAPGATGRLILNRQELNLIRLYLFTEMPATQFRLTLLSVIDSHEELRDRYEELTKISKE